MSLRLLLATGDDGLDAALSGLADVVACERLPEAALAAARRVYPDAAIVAARLSGEETDALVEALLDEGVRVLWLSGRPREPRERAAAEAGAADCQVVVEPFDAADLVRRLGGSREPSPSPSSAGPSRPVAHAGAAAEPYDPSRRMRGAGAEEAGRREAADGTASDGKAPDGGEAGGTARGGAAAGHGAGSADHGAGSAVHGADAAVHGVDAAVHGAGGVVRTSDAPVTGLTVFLGALPGCGTSTAAVAWARSAVAGGMASLVMIDAHAERAHLAHLLLGCHLDPLIPGDRACSWRHARGAEQLRRCLVEVEPGLYLLPLAFDPDPPERYPWAAAPCGPPDLSVRWTASTVTADVSCGREITPGDVIAVLRALGSSGRVVRLRASGEDLSDADRDLWTKELGVWVADGAARRPGGPATRLVAEVDGALRVCRSVAPAWVVDMGAPAPLTAGVPDARVSWAARSGRVVVVTRADAIGAAAASRMLTTLRAEAKRAGAELRAEVVEGVRGCSPPALPREARTRSHRRAPWVQDRG